MNDGEGGVQAGSSMDLLGGAGGDAASGAGGGDGGAAAAAGGDGGAGAGAAGAAPAEWLSGLSSDVFKEGGASHRDYAASKGWKTMDDVLTSYREAENSLRSGNRIAVPGENATPEERAAFNKAIGVPDDTAGYAIDIPNGADGKPIPVRQDLLDRLSAKALAAGMPAGAYKEVVADFIQADMEALAGHDRARQADANAWVKAQGEAGTEALAAIDRAATALGLTREDMVSMRNSSMGSAKVMDMLSRIGRSMREDSFTGSAGGKFDLSGKDAQAQIDSLRSDPVWVKEAMKPGTPQNLQYKRLQDMVGAAADRDAQAA